MKHRKLNELEVSAIGLGCMGMSEFYGETNDTQSIKTIHRAIDLGVTLIDTADCYGAGHNEQLIAKALTDGKREKVILASKWGITRDENDPKVRGVRSDKQYLKKCVEQSLINLKTDYIDLYYVHRINPNTPIEETVEGMAELIKEGKINHIGLNETNAENIKRAHKIHAITAIQAEYSLYCRFTENTMQPLCRELGIGFVPYSPLGRGMLTGTVDFVEDLPKTDARHMIPRLQKENWLINKKIADTNQQVAIELGVSPAQVALAWVLSKYNNIVPIPGTKQEKYLEDNVEAVDLCLSYEHLAILDNCIPKEGVQGIRYPEAFMKTYNLDE
jgi:aryl-alcohol dehydrogenase-like predicted oxidoreductase